MDDRCLNTRKYPSDLENDPFEFVYNPLGWIIQLGFHNPNLTLQVNNVLFSEMAEAPPRERAALARTAIKMQMHGPKKTAKFGLLRKG